MNINPAQKSFGLFIFIPSAPGKKGIRNPLEVGLNINEKGIVCQEKSTTRCNPSAYRWSPR